MSWSNLALWNLQIALVVAVAAALATIFRLRPAPVRLAYWQALLALCLLLPFIQPWRCQTVTLPSEPVVSMPALSSPVPVQPPRQHTLDWSEAAAAILAGGILLRAGWFALGLFRLARYRRTARLLHPLPAPLADACRRLEVYPEIALSDDVAGPVTFGFLDPVVLLPARFGELEPEVQSAVVSHELLHVRRRDWLFTAIEEFVRAVFWFHPAIWWTLGQIQLAREQSVDRAVVKLSEARERYVDALLALSGARSQLDLAPAPLFLRRRHLTARVAAILKEADMSKGRILAALAACASGLVIAGWLICARLPLEAAPEYVQDAPGVTVTGADRMLHRSAVPYPAEAREKNIEGTLILDVQVGPDGTVTEANVLSGPPELRNSTIKSVLGWHFRPDAAGRQHVIVEFRAGAAAIGAATPPVTPGMPSAPPKVAPNTPQPKMIIGSIDIFGLAPPSAAALRNRLPLKPGDALERGALRNFQDAVKAFDPNLVAIITAAANDTNAAPGTVKASIQIRPRSSMPDPAKVVPHIVKIAIEGLAPDAEQELRARLPIREGQTIQADDMRRLDEAVKAFDPHLALMPRSAVPAPRVAPDGMLLPPDSVDVVLQIAPMGNSVAPAPAPSFPPTPGVPRIRVGGGVQQMKLKHQVVPVYPDQAKEARLQGVVRLNALIGADGNVKSLSVVAGHPMLVPAAMEAIKQWQYEPTLLSGAPVEVVTQVDVNFTLSQ